MVSPDQTLYSSTFRVLAKWSEGTVTEGASEQVRSKDFLEEAE